MSIFEFLGFCYLFLFKYIILFMIVLLIIKSGHESERNKKVGDIDKVKKEYKKSKVFLYSQISILIILIIGIGVYYHLESIRINNLPTFEEMEIQAFNSNFEKYQGVKMGYEVKALIIETKDIRYDGYSEEEIPSITVIDEDGTILYEEDSYEYKDDIDEYKSAIGKIRNSLINKQYYFVDFDYDSNGKITRILITQIENSEEDEIKKAEERIQQWKSRKNVNY